MPCRFALLAPFVRVPPVIVKTVLHTHHCWFGGSCGCGWSLDVVGMGLVGMLEVLTDKKSQFKWIIHAKVREGVQMKKTFLNGHCPYRSYPPPGGATGNVVLFFGRQKRHLARITESNSNWK